MPAPPAHHRYGPWLLLGLLLALLLAACLALLVQQYRHEVHDARRAAERELQLISSVLSVSLQKGNYQEIDTLLEDWGTTSPDIVALELTTANRFALGDYRRAQPATRTLDLSTTIRYSYRGLATLSAQTDLAPVHAHLERLVIQLAAGFLLLAGVLVYLVRVGIQRQHEALRLRNEIGQRQRAEEALFEAKERAEVTLHSIGDAVITTDARGQVEYFNPVAEQLTGWSDAEARGRPLAEVFPIVNEFTREPVETPVERVLREGLIVGLANHTVLLTRDGREIAIEDSAAPIRNRAGAITGVVMVFHDVTASRAMAHQLSWQATHDALTGLINRREFETRVSHALAVARGGDDQHALLYIDLDQFKLVNDTCGHGAGDELLRQLSGLKQRHLRSSDTLARLGGDEFGVLLEHCPLDRAMHIAETLREAASGFRFLWEGRVFDIGVSIGVVPIHAQSGTLAGVLAAADMACYAAKESGRNRVHVYRESDTELVQRHGEMLWVARLNEALKQDRFVLYRQAIAPLHGEDRGTHFEVLLRLHGEDGALISPGTFLPAAERYNLMPAIDRWVVHRVLSHELRQPCCPAGSECMIAINLSGASLGDERFLAFLSTELARDGVDPRRLCFEVTETAAIANLSRAAEFMREMHALGCRFALDDFGAGLSSFAYLKHLPVDFLKIDGNLVKAIVDSRIDFAMVQAINDIGHTLGIRTVAEFVENDAIRARLAQINVDFIQGYGVAHPEPLET